MCCGLKRQLEFREGTANLKLRKCAKAELGWGGKEAVGEGKAAYRFEDLEILESVLPPPPHLSPGKDSQIGTDPAWTTGKAVRTQDAVNVKKWRQAARLREI